MEQEKPTTNNKRSFDVAFLSEKAEVKSANHSNNERGSLYKGDDEDSSDRKSAFTKVVKRSLLQYHGSNGPPEGNQRILSDHHVSLGSSEEQGGGGEPIIRTPNLSLQQQHQQQLLALHSLLRKAAGSNAGLATTTTTTTPRLPLPPPTFIGPPQGYLGGTYGFQATAAAAAVAATAAATTTAAPVCGGPTTAGPTAPSLTNTCAKCGITFRMTSDLVYHMRTHHSREKARLPNVLPPPKQTSKKKSSSKNSSNNDHNSSNSNTNLPIQRCPLCGEGFLERHHLTRHIATHTGSSSNDISNFPK